MSNPDNSAKHDINILYYKARSLFPKIDELQFECANRRPDIVCIVESWIDNSVTNGELLLSAYQLYRRDRNRHGGGILIYVKNKKYLLMYARYSKRAKTGRERYMSQQKLGVVLTLVWSSQFRIVMKLQ